MIRKNKARSDATVAAIRKTIAQVFHIPPEAIRIVNPNGRQFSRSTTVKRVRRQWSTT